MATLAPAQQLTGIDTSANIADALAARIKDPLWFLARQWQTGEFEAENGGSPAQLSIVAREHPIDTLVRGGVEIPVPADMPLDFAVEQEDDDGTSPLWKSEALQYAFEVKGKAFGLEATGYSGRNLDWYHFDIAARSAGPTTPPETETRMVPTAMSFRGAPHPRWWRFEDGDAYFEQPRDPEPNIAFDAASGVLLPRHQQLVCRAAAADRGHDPRDHATERRRQLRRRHRNRAERGAGRFGMVDVLVAPGRGPQHRIAAVYMPNIAIDVLDNDEVEEVVFTRDEEANLVWASERLVTLADGTPSRNGETEAPPPQPRPSDPRPIFKLQLGRCRLAHPLPAALYQPVGDHRRDLSSPCPHGRSASLAQPQYRGVVVARILASRRSAGAAQRGAGAPHPPLCARQRRRRLFLDRPRPADRAAHRFAGPALRLSG